MRNLQHAYNGYSNIVCTKVGISCFYAPSGHSLGGAMATLAAYDIRTSLQAQTISNVEVACYTFAAPRTGNHAFARYYKTVVPDTWSVINDQVRIRHLSVGAGLAYMQQAGMQGTPATCVCYTVSLPSLLTLVCSTVLQS